MFFNGYGMVEKGKVVGFIPVNLVDSNQVEAVSFRFLVSKDKSHVEPRIKESVLLSNYLGIDVSHIYFICTDTLTMSVWGEVPVVRDGVQFGAVTLIFKIPSAANPGEHRIPLTFTYLYRGVSYISSTTVTLRVLSDGERYRTVLAGALALLLSLFAFLQKLQSAAFVNWWNERRGLHPITLVQARWVKFLVILMLMGLVGQILIVMLRP